MRALKKSLGVLYPAIRISFALVLLTNCILFSAEMFGFTPSEAKFKLESRGKFSETLAIQFSVMSYEKDIKKIHKLIRYVVKRNPDILSAGIRLDSGQLIFKSGNHDQLWKGYKKKESSATHVLVPLFKKGRLWGKVELRFSALNGETLKSYFNHSMFKLNAFVLIIGFFVYLAFMLRTLRQIDPSSVIPERVNAAFDTLAEGVIILDENEQIVLSNTAFNEKIGQSSQSLLGFKASELKWERLSKHKSGEELPWVQVLETGKNLVGIQLILHTAHNKAIKFVINASPIFGEKNKTQGVLVTLDDITELEERNTELQTIVTDLEETHAEIKQKNKELHYLATRDPMTGCLNRRAFFEQFDVIFDSAGKNKTELSCFMVDLDHFKLVNDNYGHAMGDKVIKLLAEILQSNTRKIDLVGRYGGEEFCVVLPGQTRDEAFVVAERIRLHMKDESTKRYEGGPRVTASIGIASIFDKPANPSDLNNLADEALYVAKESGRNRVIIWTKESESTQATEKKEPNTSDNSVDIEEDTEVKTLKNRVLELEQIATQFSTELEYHKNYDALTGLPNQILFCDRISQAIERGLRQDQLVAVLIIDINMQSQLNSNLGDSDQLLQNISKRLNTIFRQSDSLTQLTVSRFANNEFAVLLTEISQREQVTWIVKRFLDEINKPITVEENMLHIDSHVGISLYPIDANSVDELISNAMSAKQYCKKLESNSEYQFFDNHIQELSIKQLQLEKDLCHSIENEHWILLYQPKLDIKQNKIIGAEALIRWNHPQRGLLSPFEFIEFAEQRGLLIPIGDWVIKRACQQIKEWTELGVEDCKIAINLSATQLMQKDIVNKIFTTLEQYNVAPRLLELEITETCLMENLQLAMESLQRLSSRGIKIAIDDFGTGFSSLSYLKHLPINTLKIDRTFIKDVCNDDNDKKIVQNLISLAHSMDLTVVAEGIEDKEQFELLSQYSCDVIQGYLLSKPVAANVFIEMMKNSYKII